MYLQYFYRVVYLYMIYWVLYTLDIDPVNVLLYTRIMLAFVYNACLKLLTIKVLIKLKYIFIYKICRLFASLAILIVLFRDRDWLRNLFTGYNVFLQLDQDYLKQLIYIFMINILIVLVVEI